MENPLEGYIYLTYISPAVPKLWYFSDYFNLPCRINLNEFSAGKPTGSLSSEEFKIAKALFELSGLQLSDIQSETNFEAFKAQLEATSNSITDDMFEYWTTNQNLEIRFDIEHADNNARYLNIRIYNSKHRVTLPLKIVVKASCGSSHSSSGLAKFKGTRIINIFCYWMSLALAFMHLHRVTYYVLLTRNWHQNIKSYIQHILRL